MTYWIHKIAGLMLSHLHSMNHLIGMFKITNILTPRGIRTRLESWKKVDKMLCIMHMELEKECAILSVLLHVA